ncbi:acyl-CoA dehydrogenase, C-terminal domain protein [Mycobacterium xenopi 4042]|uniref:Acyl-CoA dehydrogenase, C-terminal domain protein n=1 Tax=Mycobacterium xenopi 4042 TaxID=1299334 RepID=X8BJ23_MYCXE|nr:acyl-CoA dehydrogenase, C-terminal domain protein [Mycobacterium xenopi 4042]
MNAMRIHGGYGYSCEYDVERYFRDAPLMIIGEGTNEIQRNVITAQLGPAAGSEYPHRAPPAHHHRPEYVANSRGYLCRTNRSMSLKEVMTMLAFDRSCVTSIDSPNSC